MKKREFIYLSSSEPFEDADDSEKSKTQIKKEMDDLQKIGQRLVTLNKDQLKKVEINEMLLDAILLAQKITSHEAKRRQLQFIGKLMRNLSEQEVELILEYFDVLDGKSQQQTQLLHFLENWRLKLIDSDNALTDFLSEYPSTDIQALRNLIRNARKEKELNKPPKAFREIFVLLKSVILEQQS
jgi:ribosome-associated protein